MNLFQKPGGIKKELKEMRTKVGADEEVDGGEDEE